jgi:hypothetical protein
MTSAGHVAGQSGDRAAVKEPQKLGIAAPVLVALPIRAAVRPAPPSLCGNSRNNAHAAPPR